MGAYPDFVLVGFIKFHSYSSVKLLSQTNLRVFVCNNCDNSNLSLNTVKHYLCQLERMF